MLINCLAVGLGGCIGSILRYLVGLAFSSANFPYATLAVNVLGSFVLALIAGLVLQKYISSEELSLFLRVGLCGGFTTMSTFSVECMTFINQGAWTEAILYSVLTYALCIGAALLGYALVKA